MRRPRTRQWFPNKLKLRWLAGFVGGVVFACRAPTPGEMPPLAPRPEPVQPMPADPKSEPTTTPVPGAPDPIPADAAATAVPVPEVRADRFQSSAVDAGTDAAVLPQQIPDALPLDANKQPESS